MRRGNDEKITFYVCTTCQNVITDAQPVAMQCCGHTLQTQKPTERQALSVTEINGQWSIASNHPMTKDHYISLIASVAGGQLQLIPQFPEWSLQLSVPKRKYRQLFWYDTVNKLFSQLVK